MSNSFKDFKRLEEYVIMKSIGFPKMFSSTSSTNVVSDATSQNALLILRTEKGEFPFDPYFGIRLKKYIFEQNSYILKDIIIDEIYTQLALFMPQLRVKRSDIKIISDTQKAKLYCTFKATNQTSFKTDTYQLVLYQEDDQKQ